MTEEVDSKCAVMSFTVSLDEGDTFGTTEKRNRETYSRQTGDVFTFSHSYAQKDKAFCHLKILFFTLKRIFCFCFGVSR